MVLEAVAVVLSPSRAFYSSSPSVAALPFTS